MVRTIVFNVCVQAHKGTQWGISESAALQVARGTNADKINAACHKPQLDVQCIQKCSNGIINSGMQKSLW
jgi:hypothetical protein